MDKAIKLFCKVSANTTRFYLKRHIMSSSSRAQNVVEELKSNPYYDKYAGKIAKLQQTSPEEFLSRVEEHEVSKTKKDSESNNKRQFSSVLKPKQSLEEVKSDVKEKHLSDIMKVEMIYDKDAKDIKRIWEEYHIKKDVISATIPKEEYEAIMNTSKEHPIFLFPLPRTQGYEFIMLQFQGNTAHFTPLLCYQVHKENAPECLTMAHYTELKDSKGIILMRGEFDKNVIDAKEAQCLANQFQMYYGSSSDEQKQKLLEIFTKKPDNFKHMDLISQLENISLSDAKI